MSVTQHPLHRTVHAELPYTAPALGHDDQASTMLPVVSVRGRLSREPGSRSGTRCRQTDFPWPAAFPAPPPLPSLSVPALFGGCLATTQQSDYPAPWPIGVRPQAFRCALHAMLQKTRERPGSRAKCFRACTGSVTARGRMPPRPIGSTGVAFGFLRQARHPGPPAVLVTGHVLRGSIPGLRVPLSTLRPHPCECARMARGRRSWLSFQRMTLSFTTLCRS